MKNINKIGKVSEIIGKMLFYFLIALSIIVVISFNLSKLGDQPDGSIIIGSILGNILAVFIIYFFWRLLFRPIYNFNNNVRLKLKSQLSEQTFRSKWSISLFCSLLFGILFVVGTFGISLILMIPHYIFLSRVKRI